MCGNRGITIERPRKIEKENQPDAANPPTQPKEGWVGHPAAQFSWRRHVYSAQARTAKRAHGLEPRESIVKPEFPNRFQLASLSGPRSKDFSGREDAFQQLVGEALQCATGFRAHVATTSAMTT